MSRFCQFAEELIIQLDDIPNNYCGDDTPFPHTFKFSDEEETEQSSKLIKGNKSAALWDTGFGRQNLKGFIEEHVQTEYMVINSHGHHICWMFI